MNGNPTIPGPAITVARESLQPRPPSMNLMRASVVRAYALEVSKAKRAGKFTRVSKEFIVACEAQLAGAIGVMGRSHENLTPRSGRISFTTGPARKKAAEAIERLAQVIVYGKVTRHAGIGVTLKD